MMILPDWHLVMITGKQITFVLNTILNKKLKVEQIVSQHHLKGNASNSKEIIMDVTAKDSQGNVYDIEIQRAVKSKEIRDVLTFYKEQGGNPKMCELMEQYVKEHSEIRAKDMAQDMAKEEVEKKRLEMLKENIITLSNKLEISLLNAMDLLDVCLDDQEKLLQMM